VWEASGEGWSLRMRARTIAVVEALGGLLNSCRTGLEGLNCLVRVGEAGARALE